MDSCHGSVARLSALTCFLFGPVQHPQPVVQLRIFQLRPEVVGVDGDGRFERVHRLVYVVVHRVRHAEAGAQGGRLRFGQTGPLEPLDGCRDVLRRDRVRISPEEREERRPRRDERARRLSRVLRTWWWTPRQAGHGRFGLEDEVRIRDRAHFRNVQACQFALRRDALTDEPVDEQVEHEAHDEHEAEERRHAHELRHELARRRRRTSP